MLDRKDWSKLDHDARFVASMPFKNTLIFQAVKWGTTYHRSEVVKQDCIRALGRGSRWSFLAVNALKSVLTDGSGPDVKVALDALSMREREVATSLCSQDADTHCRNAEWRLEPLETEKGFPCIHRGDSPTRNRALEDAGTPPHPHVRRGSAGAMPLGGVQRT